jgi:outer membrane biogenesis lipoprotein LolB
MSFTKRLLNSLLLAAAVLLLGGCASTDQPESEQAGSNLPWNRPEKWEGPGVMGSMMQGSH